MPHFGTKNKRPVEDSGALEAAQVFAPKKPAVSGGVAGPAGPAGPAGVAGPAGSGNGVNLQTGTTYTYVSGDASKLVSHSNAASIAATLPQATGSFASPFVFDVGNRGPGTLTITPTTSTIDGAANLALTTNQGCRIFSDGTNWYTQRGIGSGSGGGSTISRNSMRGTNTGVLSTSSTSFVNIGTFSIAISAVVGDVLEMCISGTLVSSSSTYTDLTFNVGGTNLTDQFVEPYTSISSVPHALIAYRAEHTVVSGDISGGTVTCIPRWSVNSGTVTFYNSGGYTGLFTVINYGH